MRKSVIALGLVMLFLFGISGCGSEIPFPSVMEKSDLSEGLEKAGGQVRMTTGNTEVMIILNDSEAAVDFAGLLPLELELIERSSFAKGMTLPRALTTDEETTREYEVGDFGYWAAGLDLAIFYDDIYVCKPLFRYSPGKD